MQGAIAEREPRPINSCRFARTLLNWAFEMEYMGVFQSNEFDGPRVARPILRMAIPISLSQLPPWRLSQKSFGQRYTPTTFDPTPIGLPLYQIHWR